MLNKINEMVEMQKALDKAIYTEHNTEFNAEKCRMAILDEVGELTHELKGEWCWWKKTQKPVDREKVLGELVDVWHFVMSYHYHHHKDNYEESVARAYARDTATYLNVVRNLMNLPCIEGIVVLTNYLGFTIDDIYNGYIEKNKENYNRLARGY